MNPAYLSLAALIVAIVVSCFSRLNVGILSLAFAWIIAVVAGIAVSDVMSGFPVSLFLTLAGVTLLFTQAQLNGTLDRIAQRAMAVCRGNAGLIPIMFFVIASILSAIGPGHIATTALIAPMAMAVAARAQIPAFLMAIMVGHGATSGAVSPVAPTGIIVTEILENIGLPGYEARMYFSNLLAHVGVAFAGYLLFGGWRLFAHRYSGSISAEGEAGEGFDLKNWITIVVILILLVGVLFFGVNVGMGAFAGAVVLALLRAADHEDAIKRMPWGVIIMVSGVTVLIAMLERTQGLDLFTDLLANFATPDTATGMIALVTGVISVYSSTSGVVLPALLPTIPGLVERLGGGDPIALASAMSVGGHLVDVSPLSTIGALCIAALVPGTESSKALFNKLLAWGLSMAVVGAIVSYMAF